MNVSHDGLQSVDNIRQLRTKLPNDIFRDATGRLTEIFQTDVPQTFSWKKDCRSSYMSKSKVERLRKAGLKEMNEPSSSTSMQHAHHQKVSLRSETSDIDWKECIFCQQDKRESLHLIQELPVSSRILDDQCTIKS